MRQRRTQRVAVVVAALACLAAPTAGAAVFNGHSGWFWANPLPQGNTLRALAFAGEHGYAVGDFGTVLRTDDAGATWSGLITGTTAPLRVVRTIAADTIVVGGKCVVMRSDDSGASFKVLPWRPPGARCRTQLRSLAFPSSDVGYLVLGDGSVLRTHDAGASWSPRTAIPGSAARGARPPARPTDVYFTSLEIGFVTTDGGVIYRTADGGTSWSPVASVGRRLDSVFFPDSRTGYAVGGISVLKTTDGGATWFPPGLAGYPQDFVGSPKDLDWIRCASATDCIAATAPGEELLRTSDGAATWSAISPATRPLYAAGYSASGRVVAVGARGTTVTSNDGGRTFTTISSELSATFKALRQASRSTAYAFGPAGALARTTDGGATWSALTPPGTRNLVDVAFAGARTGFALDTDGDLVRSDDAGMRWRLLDTGTFLRPRAIAAPDAAHIVLVGPRGVRRSFDGGLAFTRLRDRAVAKALFGHAQSLGRFVAASGRHAIAVSSDAGKSWRSVPLPERGKALVKVDFVKPTVAFALTGDGRVWKTASGGHRWTELPALATHVGKDLDFSDPEHGWVAVSDFGGDVRGYVMRTSDGGQTWRAQLVDSGRLLPGALAALDDQTAIAITRGNHLLATERGGDVGRPSSLALSIKRLRPGRPGVVAINGMLEPAQGGETVVVSERVGRGSHWLYRDVTVSSTGRFTVFADVHRTTLFVAQWAGDDERIGAGSHVLAVPIRKR